MKRKKKFMPFACLFAFTTIIICSCTKDSSTVSDNSGSSFTATVGGIDWKADSIWAYLVHDSVHEFKTLTITGYGASKELSVIITDSSHAGADSAVAIQTYSVGASSWWNAASFIYASDPVSIGSSDTAWSKYGVGYDGQASITSNDASTKKVSGSFHFDVQAITLDSAGIAIDTVKVTNGLFKNILYNYSH